MVGKKNIVISVPVVGYKNIFVSIPVVCYKDIVCDVSVVCYQNIVGWVFVVGYCGSRSSGSSAGISELSKVFNVKPRIGQNNASGGRG